MSAKRTIQRDGWLITVEGETLEIARDEWSDRLKVPLAQVPLLLADLREISEAASPRRSLVEILDAELRERSAK